MKSVKALRILVPMTAWPPLLPGSVLPYHKVV